MRLAVAVLGLMVISVASCNTCPDCGTTILASCSQFDLGADLDGGVAFREVAASVASHCDGGIPDGSVWGEDGGPSAVYDAFATYYCLARSADGQSLVVCATPVTNAISAALDAGNCAEAAAVRCTGP
jgi:hypothetical protein